MIKWLATAPIILVFTALLLAGCGAAPPSADSGSQPVAAVTQTTDGYGAGQAQATADETIVPGTIIPADMPTITIEPAPPVPPAPKPMLPLGATSLFSADFDNGSLNGWTIVNQDAPYEDPASWLAKDGYLLQNGDSSGSPSDIQTVAKAGNEGWTNYTLTAEALSTGGDLIGVTFRHTQAGFYKLVLAAKAPNSAPKLWLEKVVDGKSTIIAQNTTWPGYEVNTWYQVSVTVKGSSIKASIAGQQVLDLTNARFPNGAIGMYAMANGGASFDNVLVTKE